jgi:thiol-disulfide isomerase/thioredoxin
LFLNNSYPQHLNISATIFIIENQFSNLRIYAYMKPILRLIFVFLTIPVFANPLISNFWESSLISAQNRSKITQRPYMIVFESPDCLPCQWMDNQTFENAQVAGFIEQNLIAVKVNIRTEEGKSLIKKHRLTQLPTMIIFDKNDIEKGRLDEPVNARGMLDFIRRYAINVNGTKPLVNTAKPNDYQAEAVAALVPQESPASPTVDTPARRVNASSPGGTFSIQIGAFATKTAAYEVMGRLNDKYATAATIYPGFTNGKNWYKVSIGVFHSRQEANDFKFKMRGEGFSDAFVKVW